MKPLAKTITSGSGATQFTYRELIRKGMHAIYEQWQFGKLRAYEVFAIQSHNGYIVQGTYIEPAESMPSASAWGISGFTYSQASHENPRPAAFKRLAQMISQ